MDEPPADLPDDALATSLRTHYGLDAEKNSFLPLGRDSSAWVYRVQAADTTYFLKVHASVTNAPSLVVPRYLQDHGTAHVVAPLPTTAGALWAAAGHYALTLYPFITGTTGMDHGMAEQQWIAYGAILRQIHSTQIASQLAQLMQRETFVPEGAAMVGAVEAHIDAQTVADPVAQDLAIVWRERQDTIHTLVARAERLGRQLADRAPPFVLCHADIHTNNVLLDAAGQVWIVDWDDTVLAPKERDLMFVVGGGIDRAVVGPREEALFLQGYGAISLDSLALTYYRYAWAVGDIGAYGMEVALRPDLSVLSRQVALDRFLGLFAPGRIVALALESNSGADGDVHLDRRGRAVR